MYTDELTPEQPEAGVLVVAQAKFLQGLQKKLSSNVKQLWQMRLPSTRVFSSVNTETRVERCREKKRIKKQERKNKSESNTWYIFSRACLFFYFLHTSFIPTWYIFSYNFVSSSGSCSYSNVLCSRGNVSNLHSRGQLLRCAMRSFLGARFLDNKERAR